MFDVVTIGTVTRDVFLSSPLFRVVHDPKHLGKLGIPEGDAQCFALGAKIRVEEPILTIGGGAANSANTFARQGFRTAALVKVGKDPNGDAVVADLGKARVRPIVLRDKRAGTGYSVILRAPTGERTVLSYRGASNDIKPREVPYRRIKARWAYIVTACIPFTTLTRIVAHLKRDGAHIALAPSQEYLDMGKRRLRQLFDKADAVFMNREEAAGLTGCAYRDEREIFRRCDAIINGIVAVTDGPRGVTVSDGGHLYRAGIYKEKKLVDRTGAGDAFGSGFVAGLMRRSTSKEEKFTKAAITYAIRLGSANGASVVEQIGAHTGALTRRQFEAQPRWKRFRITVKSL